MLEAIAFVHLTTFSVKLLACLFARGKLSVKL